MDVKRGILIAVAFYIVTLITGIILTTIMLLSFDSPQNLQNISYISTIAITVLLTSFASVWYFKKVGIQRNLNEGLKLGLTFILVGIVLDLLQIIIALILDKNIQGMSEYYKTFTAYIPWILVLISATFIGSRGKSVEKEIIKKQKTKKRK
ncbi:hypothetical protein EXS72_00735 [Candidatus Pacearchaeota archaeon]|nr:hypothetical protein [Candidatus Pacearchaeota archaeon]